MRLQRIFSDWLLWVCFSVGFRQQLGLPSSPAIATVPALARAKASRLLIVMGLRSDSFSGLT